jgi:serine/threonine-protein kinase
LRALGLGWAVTTVVSSSVPEGRVKAQRPTQGTQLRKGETVTLTVSSGPPEVDVPDLVGLDEATARHQLTAAGLVVRVVDRTTADPDEDGMVLEQSPSGGGSVELRETVTITVGRLA